MLQCPRQVPLLLEHAWPRSAAADVIITRTQLQGALCTHTGFTILFISHKRGQEERQQHVGAEAQLLPWLEKKVQGSVIVFKNSPSKTHSWDLGSGDIWASSQRRVSWTLMNFG